MLCFLCDSSTLLRLCIQVATTELQQLKGQVSNLHGELDGVGRADEELRALRHKCALTEKDALEKGYRIRTLQAALTAKVCY